MRTRYYFFLYFFFFQAEDGIRYYKVTGVQTCALPISLEGADPRRGFRPSVARPLLGHFYFRPCAAGYAGSRCCKCDAAARRSEERRVGKGGRGGGGGEWGGEAQV